MSREKLEKVMRNLERNNMTARYAPDRAGAVREVAALLRSGESVAVGGSVTLEETGILDLLQGGEYRFIDRYEAGLTEAEHKRRLVEAFGADVFLCSANAITEDGEIYQVDGLSNRIAPLVYGPERVILVVGVNKLVPDLDAAVERVREVTVPAIVKRRDLAAPCVQLGKCVAAGEQDMAMGCMCDERRCCNFLIMGRQRIQGRVTVVLVDESLGY